MVTPRSNHPASPSGTADPDVDASGALRFRVLGHISAVRDDGTPVPLASASQRRLLGFLASRADTVTSIGTIGLHLGLTDGAVRTAIARLRRRLGPGSDLVTEGPGYLLMTDRIDSVEFHAAVSAALAGNDVDGDARSSLERALAMWRGEAYAEFSHEEWAITEAARLEEMRAGATEELVDVLLRQGEHEIALDRASSVIERHPFRDRPRGQRMRALAATGRTTEALRSFHEYRALLREEVGTVPSPALVDLERLIAAGDLPIGDVRSAPSPPPRAPSDPPMVALPRDRGFGLDELSEQVASDLAEHRLVTLTGVGGIGKTRLALAVADRSTPDVERVVLVDLRSASSPETVLAVAARALGVEFARRQEIARLLDRRRTLVVVDNCEHVLEPAAALVGEIVAGAPSSRVLATSRQPLMAPGERVRIVRPMSRRDATALFLDRASRWHDAFAGGDERDLAQIEEICVRLDGIPLAIELAAACVAHMSVPEIAAQLDDRLTFFPGDPTRSQQQRTLRATMDWSYDLLDEDARSLLRAVSVFAAGFEPASAAAVWGRSPARTLAGLGALVRASLVLAHTGGGSTRYELLETVRLHAEAKASDAGELERLRDAHAAHYAGRLDAIDPVEVLGVSGRSRPDIANHDRMLERVEAHRDLGRLGELAWRTAMVHRADCWSDAAGRYLGRDDVAAALSGMERSCYLAASLQNANVLGRWADQLRFAEAGLATATGPVRVVLLRGAASACSVLAPERVDALVDEAMALAAPDDTGILLELRRTRVDGLLLAGELEVAAAELRSLWAEVVSTGFHRHGVRPLAGIDLLWVDVILRLDDEVTELADVLAVLPGGAVAGHCGHAVVAARHGRGGESARRVLLAAEAASTEGVPLVDNDVTVVAALRAVELGEPERACGLLDSVPGGLRSLGSHQLYRYTRDLVRERLDPDAVADLRSAARHQGATSVTATELARLRTEAAAGTADDGRGADASS